MKNIKNIVTLFFFIFLVNSINCHKKPPLFKCEHNEEDEKNPLPNVVIEPSIKQKEAYKRRMDNEVDSDGFKEFNIYLDFENIKSDINKYNLNKYQDLFISSMQKAVSTLQSLLRVKPLQKGYQITTEDLNTLNITKFNTSMFGNEAIAKDISFNDLNIDLAIFGTLEDLGDSTLATASAKKYQDTSAQFGQPFVGIVKINKNVNYSKPNSQEYFQTILVHEFTHILGFSKNFFQNFFDNYFEKTVNGINRRFLKGDKLLEVAKKYYDCDDIEGVELENQGGSGTAGSHWEARILLGEYMNGYSYTEEQVISEFTLAVLEDSGYYKPNYYTGGLMRYGKHKGCAFLKDPCVNKETRQINEYFENEFFDSINSLTSIDPSCSSGRQSRTYNTFWNDGNIPEEFQYFENKNQSGYEPADFCPVPMAWAIEENKRYYVGHCSKKGSQTEYGTKIENQDLLSSDYNKYVGEVLSDHSFCFLSSLSKTELISRVVRPNCYEVFCSDQSLTIKVLKDYIVCPRSGGQIKVENYEGFLLCPDYNLICTGTKVCNDMFSCVEKKSEIKEDAFTYDYQIKTSQNIEKAEATEESQYSQDNYELSSNGKCPIYCKQCKDKKVCSKCKDGYELKLESNSSVTCELYENLQDGYYKNADTGIYVKCIDNCKECKDMKTCEKCDDGYYYYQKKCKQSDGVDIIKNCHEYDINGDCVKCAIGYGFKEKSKETCYPVAEFEGYYTEDGISYYPCSNKNEDWAKCYYNETEYRAKALECVSDKLLIQKGAGVCMGVEEIANSSKYYIIDEHNAGICSKTIPNCLECDSETNCLMCKSSYEFDIDKNECVKETKKQESQDSDDKNNTSTKTSSDTRSKRKKTKKSSLNNDKMFISNVNIIKYSCLLFLLIF